MKRVVTIVLIAALTGIAAPAASAWAPTDKRVAALERQVKLLNKEVTALKKELKPLKAQVRVLRDTVDSGQTFVQDEFGREKVRDLCIAVGVADLLQSTWTNVDQRVATAPAFGAQQEMWDPACPLFGVVRPGISNHPTVDFFTALISAFIG